MKGYLEKVLNELAHHSDAFHNHMILEKVGYDNQANFNRQFKSYKQVIPTQYRSAMKYH